MSEGIRDELDTTRQAASNAGSLLPGLEVGTILAGKYRVDRVLGAGGMGVVIAAYHLHLDERVAIKFLLPQFHQNRELVARFLREARAAIKIKSEHVARITDVGTLDNGAPYMVMEFLDGSDLASWISKRGPLSVEDTVEFVLQACEALAEAHVLKMVHRDLKPANLFVVRRADGLSAVRVLDFGISKMPTAAVGTSGFGVTKTTDIMGSPHYMAPEQMLASHDVDMRSDVWSLGVVIHEMITGKVPFEGGTIPEICAAILRDDPAPMSDKMPGVTPALDRIVLRCLSKERGERYQNVAELANALVDYGPRRARSSAERITRIIQEAGLGPARGDKPSAANPTQIKDGFSLRPGAGRGRPASPSLTEPKVATPAEGLFESDSDIDPRVRVSRKLYLVGAAGLAIVIGVGLLIARSAHTDSPPGASVSASDRTLAPPPPTPPALPSAVSMPPVVPVANEGPARPVGLVEGKSANVDHKRLQRHTKEPSTPRPKFPVLTKATTTADEPKSGSSPNTPPESRNRLLDLTDDRK